MTIQQPTGGLGPDPAVDWDDLRRAAVASCRHIPPWVSRDDLVQEAYLAGWRAASRWQPDGGSSFTPYVIRRAVGAVRDVLRDHSPSTRAGAREPGGPPSATAAGRALTRFERSHRHAHASADRLEARSADDPVRRDASCARVRLFRSASQWAPPSRCSAARSGPGSPASHDTSIGKRPHQQD